MCERETRDVEGQQLGGREDEGVDTEEEEEKVVEVKVEGLTAEGRRAPAAQ